MAKRYYWLKLKKDFFINKAIKKLRKIAGGDTYTIIYLKLQLLSLKDEGILFYEGIEPTFYEEMALALDEESENVRATLLFLESMGLIAQQNDHEYILTEVPYLIGSETDKAELMRKKRAREKLLSGNNVTNALPPVTKCYTEIEREIDIDIEREKEIEIDTDTEKSKKESINYQMIVNMYNDTCVSFPRVTSLSDARKKAIKARLNKYKVEDLKRAFEIAEKSDFLKGANNRDWSANFDWIIKDANLVKILDGNYDNRSTNKQSGNSKAKELLGFYEMSASWAESENG